MYSIKFPDMLSSAKTNIIENHEATISNLRLMLASWKTSLFGDPYFGTNIKRFIHEHRRTSKKRRRPFYEGLQLFPVRGYGIL